MALLKINNVRIKGAAACAPKDNEENRDYPYFERNDIDRIIDTIGVERRRILKKGQTCSDLAYLAAEKLIAELGWEKESIGLLMFCSPSRDYIQPDTACVLQGRLGISHSAMCFDMTLGCSAWTYGITTAASIMQTGAVKRALVLNGNMGSAENAYEDRTIWPLIGDAGTATALEFEEGATIWCEAGSRGEDYHHVIIPDGGRRNPVTEESFVLTPDAEGVKRSRLHLYMNGMEVFSFGLKTAPKSIEAVLEFSGKKKEDIDMFLFHQCSYYLLKKIVKKEKLDIEKVPFSLFNWGNTGACCIPNTMVTERAEQLRHGKNKVIACAFGVGFSWATLCFETENMVIPELIEMD